MPRIGVDILGNAKSLLTAFKQAELGAAEFNLRMNKVGQSTRGVFAGAGFNKGALLFGSGAFVGAAIGTEILKTSISAASDLNEQLSKSQQVFGEASKSIEDFGNSSAQNLGISKRAAVAAAATFGNLFRTVDLAPAKNAELSSSLVQLAADLASFNNVQPDEALLALRSGLIGEAEPLRRFGVLLSESRVQQEALAETGKKSTKALTDQEKVLARYKIILQDTASAQGDVARTSGSLANQQRQLKANFDDLAARVGGAFLPAADATVTAINSVFKAFDHPKPELDFADVIQNLSALQRARAEMKAFAGESDIASAALDDAFSQLGDKATELSKVMRGHLSPALRQTAVDTEGYTRSLVDAAERTQDLAGVSDFLASDMADAASRIAAATKQINDALAQDPKAGRKRFTGFLKGLDLKLDKAELSGSIDAQIKVLQEREQAILRREAKVGKKFELEVELTATRKQIKDLEEQKAQNIRSRQEAALAKQKNQEQDILALKQKQRDALRQQLAEQKRIADEAKRALDAAKAQASSVFGTLFQVDEAERRAFLGGTKGRKTTALPGAGGGEDARGLLTDLNAQIKSFKTLQANILELQRKGAPQSLLEAARSGQISADQVAALASADAKTLNAIFKNVRLADKLITRAAKAEINAKDVSLRANTVTIRGAIAATSSEHGRGDSGDIVVHVNTHVDGKKIDASIERHRKKRVQPTRGRSGGKR